MSTVALIDYGSGNLRSAEKALQAVAGALRHPPEVLTTADPDQVRTADRIVLPGVGAFAACMDAVRARPGLVEAMAEGVRRRGAPFLGVCVGMQLLATHGLEFGAHEGLGWIPGEVRRLRPANARLKVPHMGWNDLDVRGHGLFEGVPPQMYFTHSFAFHAARDEDVAATSEHGEVFTAAVARGNVAGVQFHPEKSQAAGLALIRRFLEWRP
jgi:glutamine amidotransferase